MSFSALEEEAVTGDDELGTDSNPSPNQTPVTRR